MTEHFVQPAQMPEHIVPAEHIVPKKVYFAIFFALIALTAVTVTISFFDLGRLNAVVALTIAVFKAILVILYFMHLRYERRILLWSLVPTLVIVFVLMGHFFPDAFRLMHQRAP